MHYIKDIFESKITEHAHNKFVRYSKGNFIGPLVSLKVQKAGIKVATSFHFVDELLELVSSVLKDRVVHIKGVVVWNQDLGPKFEELGIKYMKVTKSRGIFKYIIDNEIKFIDFVNNFKNYNLLVNVKTDEVTMSCKTNFPKPNKEVAKDFCKCLFPIEMKEKLFSEFAFDVEITPKLKDVLIKHKIIITDIKLPDVDNFEEARRLATRVGTLERLIYINKEEEPSIKTIDINV